jgi:hypothetical protein
VALKTSILARLQTTSIRPFFFGKPIEDALIAVQGLPIVASATNSTARPSSPSEPTQYPFNVPTYPYAISSTPGPDTDTMDASLLMSPDYVQPLLPSELAALVNQVFDPESIAWLRHSAAKKFLTWRHRTKLPGDSFIMQRQSLKRGSISSSAVGLNGAALNGTCTRSLEIGHQLILTSLIDILPLLRHLTFRRPRPPRYIPLLPLKPKLQLQPALPLPSLLALPLKLTLTLTLTLPQPQPRRRRR